MEWMDDYISYSFEYNADGIRTAKTMSESIVGYESRKEYMLDGSRIIGETMYETFDVSQGFTEQYTFIYLYDESGAPIGLKYRTPSYAEGEFDCYFFEKNLQGDIVAIYNEAGTKIGTYTYDAWGNCTITSNTTGYNFILYNNPFRYRGYYYDSETGYYYLQSRYYNPTWGRFINADRYVSTGQGMLGYNMFAYCGNNPVNRIDSTGDLWWIIAAVVLCGGIMVLTSCASSTQHEPYDSADEAALAFYEEVYSKSMDEGIEYGTEIYSRTINGKTTYNYNKPRSGDVDHVVVGKKVPNGTKYVAFAHTHPNGNSGFSPEDYIIAYKRYINMYVAGPNGTVYKYDVEKEGLSDTTWHLK